MILYATLTPPEVEATLENNVYAAFDNYVARDVVERDAYTGSYEVTPSAETQTLDTKDLRMTDNIVVNPIPSNYGLITWNGSTITVS